MLPRFHLYYTCSHVICLFKELEIRLLNMEVVISVIPPPLVPLTPLQGRNQGGGLIRGWSEGLIFTKNEYMHVIYKFKEDEILILVLGMLSFLP